MRQGQPILIIGGCGSGKTWVAKKTLELFQLTDRKKAGLMRYVVNAQRTIALAGIYTGEMYDGSDRLSMALMKEVQSIKTLCSRYRFVMEGDRFTNKTFIETVNPYILKITNDGSWGREHRQSSQSERQIKSIATRVSKIEAHEEIESSQATLTRVAQLLTE